MQGATDIEIRRAVRDAYASVSEKSQQLDKSDASDRVAQAFGYTLEELITLPSNSNMGLSCGNPTAMANLKEGETVVDLGCGGGIDVFLAAKQVGENGKAIGVDMTSEMIDLARRNASKTDLRNTEFLLGEIEHMPLQNSIADCVISNCVINLVPNKDMALREIYRILKPGGRLAISDISLKRLLPEDLRDSLYAYVGCIAGAIQIEEYKALLHDAGFKDIIITDSNTDLNVYSNMEGCCNPPNHGSDNTSNLEKTASSADRACCGPTCCDSTQPSASFKEQSAPCCASSCCGKDKGLSEERPMSTDRAGQSSNEKLGLFSFLQGHDVNDYVASIKVFATKPSA